MFANTSSWGDKNMNSIVTDRVPCANRRSEHEKAQPSVVFCVDQLLVESPPPNNGHAVFPNSLK